MSVLTRLYDFVAGTKIRSAQVDAEFDQLVVGHNDHETKILSIQSGVGLTDGSVTNPKVAPGIDMVKMADGSVTNTKVQFINSLTSNAQTQLDAKVPLTQKGAANGVAPLNASAKIDELYLPDTVLGQLEYQSTYNATTNTPTLPAASTANKGWFYVISAAGTVSSITYDIGDWIVSNGTAWQKVDNTDAVSSFNGRLGVIVPALNDYTWTQINKATSSLLDITTRSAADLSSGTLPDARRGARTGDVTSPSGSGVNTIAPLAVITAKIADLAVTNAKLSDASVGASKLVDGAITTVKIGDGQVTAAKLDPALMVADVTLNMHRLNATIDHPDGSIPAVKLASDSVTTIKILDANVTNAKLAGGIDAAKIGDGSVSTTEYQFINSLSSNAQTQIDAVTTKVGITEQRSSSLVVAASNSTASGKTAADYVCTGTGDQTTINTAIAALPVIVVELGTAQAGAASTVTLAAGASAVDNYYTGYTINILTGTGAGQSKAIAGYVGSTKVATVLSAWTTAPAVASTYNITTPSGEIVLLEGLFSIAAAITIPNNVALRGQGNGTLIKIANGTNATMNMIQNADIVNGNSGLSISKLKLDGNKANNTGTQSGIRYSVAYECAIKDTTVCNLSGTGIIISASNFNTIANNLVINNTANGLSTQTSASNNIISGNILQGNGVGILFTGSSYNSFTGNISQGNTSEGFFSVTGDYNVFNGNMCKSNGSSGIRISGNGNTVTGNYFIGNSGAGIALQGGNNSTVTGNLCQANGTHGISITSSSSGNTVTGNTCLENSQTTSLASDNILLDSTASTNNIQNNTCRQGALTNKPRYGINVNVAGNSGNLVANNDLTTGGATGAFNNAGTGTITTGVGNKLA